MEVPAAISSFLTHVRVEKGLASNTVSAYRRDLMKFAEFAQKRKTLANNLRAAGYDPTDTQAAFSAASIGAQSRAEELPLEKLASLWASLPKEKAASADEAADPGRDG